MAYTVQQLECGEGLSNDRSMKAYTHDGISWHTCEIGDMVAGDPVEVVTVPPTSRGGWECRA
jgi:hypothetical protein